MSSHSPINLREVCKRVKQMKSAMELQKYLRSLGGITEVLAESVNTHNELYKESMYIIHKAMATSLGEPIIQALFIQFSTIRIFIDLCHNSSLKAVLEGKIRDTQTQASTALMIAYLKEGSTLNQQPLIHLLNQRMTPIIQSIAHSISTYQPNNTNFQPLFQLFQILIESLQFLTPPTLDLIHSLFVNIPQLYCFIIDIANQLEGRFPALAIQVIDTNKLGTNFGRYVSLWQYCVRANSDYLKILPQLIPYQESSVFLVPAIQGLSNHLQQSIFRFLLEDLFVPSVPFLIHCLVPYLLQTHMSRIALQQRINEIVRSGYFYFPTGKKQRVLEVFTICSSFIHQENVEMYIKLVKEILVVDPLLVVSLDPVNNNLVVGILSELERHQEILSRSEVIKYYLRRLMQLDDNLVLTKYKQNRQLYTRCEMMGGIEEVMREKDLMSWNQGEQRLQLAQYSSQHILRQLGRSIRDSNRELVERWILELGGKQPVWNSNDTQIIKHLLELNTPLPENLLNWVVLVFIQGFHQQQSVIDSTYFLITLIQKYYQSIDLRLILNSMVSLTFGNKQSVIMSSGIVVAGVVYIANPQCFRDVMSNCFSQFLGLMAEPIDIALFEDHGKRRLYIVFVIYLLSQQSGIQEAEPLWENVSTLIHSMINIPNPQPPLFPSSFIHTINQFQLLSQKTPQILERYPTLPITNFGCSRIFFKQQNNTTSQIRRIYKINKSYYEVSPK